MKRKEERSKQARSNKQQDKATHDTNHHVVPKSMQHSQHSFACDKRSAPGQVEGTMNMPAGSHMHGACFDAEFHIMNTEQFQC